MLTAGLFYQRLQSLIRQPFSDIQVLPGRIYLRSDSGALIPLFGTDEYLPEAEIMEFLLRVTVGTVHRESIRRLKEEAAQPLTDRVWNLPAPFCFVFEVYGENDESLAEDEPGVNFQHHGRFRAQVSFFHSENPNDFGLSLSIRRVLPFIFSLQDLEEMGASPGFGTLVRELARGVYRNGLILLAGETGSGKSTTLTTGLDEMNRFFPTQSQNVIMLEDPIEVVHEDKQLRFLQCEIGRHVASLEIALHSALRQDPNILVIGEIRSPETLRLALAAAHNGHLVLGTIHGRSTSSLICKLVRIAGDELDALVDSLIALISQKRILLSDPQVRSTRSLTNVQPVNRDDDDLEVDKGRFRTLVMEVMRPDKNPALNSLLRKRCTDPESYYDALRKSGMPELENTFEEVLLRHWEHKRLSDLELISAAEEKRFVTQRIAEAKLKAGNN